MRRLEDVGVGLAVAGLARFGAEPGEALEDLELEAVAEEGLEVEGVEAAEALELGPALSLEGELPNSGLWVLPKTTSPAARRRSTRVESSVWRASAKKREPSVVTVPASMTHGRRVAATSASRPNCAHSSRRMAKPSTR